MTQAVVQLHSPVSDAGRTAMNRLLIAGVLLRIAVFLLASPFNSDQHLEVIRFIADHGSLPTSNALQQSFHPPLYYLLMTPIALLTSATWPVHLVSCVLSCVNLWLIRRLMDDPAVVALAPRASIRVAGFAMAATLAQLVMFGSFISNDPLTQLIGTIQFMALLRYLRQPTQRRIVILAVLVAVGLLTKGTFLLTGVAVAGIVSKVEWSGRGSRRAASAVAMFAAVVFVFGSYKYVENVARLGRPLVHNQEMKFVTPYARAMWHGPATVYDINVVRLIRQPLIEPRHPGSYPLLLYATFWYAHLSDSSFRGNFSGYERVGSLTYAAAVVPTLVFLFGVGVTIASVPRWLRRGDPVAGDTLLIAALALLLTNLAVVVAAGVHFDLWECFQARLCFQSAAPILVLFLAGMAALTDQWRGVRWFLLAFCWATVGCAALYFFVEFALARHLLAVDESAIFKIYR